MYNPKHFQLDDLALARALIDEHPLGLLIGPDADGASFVSHLPMGWGEDFGPAGKGGWWLEGHLARANPHAGWLAAQRELLVVFSGPGAYVSPRHYDSALSVPTWNYLALHVRGTVEIIEAPSDKDALLKRLIGRHEPEYITQWQGLPPDYQQKMLAGIVGFRLHVSRWQAKAKISQNRSGAERARMHMQFSAGKPNEQGVADWMSRMGLA